MLVTKAAANALNAATLQSYLNAGGIVITATGSTYPVYNTVFGTALPEPSVRIGDCSDNVNPRVQMNDGDPFWQSNPFVQEVVGGCGFNLFDLPDITWLGSASEDPDTVTLAYIKVGTGRLWLVEADWDDGDATFTEQSTRLMRYMVRTR
jgi:hypothetical protein